MLFNSCKDDRCILYDWNGNYEGRDIPIRFSIDGTTQIIEPSIDVAVTISSNSNYSSREELFIRINLFFDSNAPTVINLSGIRDCTETFLINSKSEQGPELVDLLGNKYQILYDEASGYTFTESGNIEIKLKETRIYDNPDLSTQNFYIIHTITLNI